MGHPRYILQVEDCLKGMQLLPDNSVDLVVTSPPYNMGIKYGQYRDRKTGHDYLNWCLEWAEEIRRVLKPEGSFFLNLGACPSSPLLPHELVVELTKELFVLQNTFHWIKSITVTTKTGEVISPGHFKPLQSERFVNDCHEYVFHLTKAGKTPIHRLALGVPYADKVNIKRMVRNNGRDIRCRGNTWFIRYPTITNRKKQRPHPATFPPELAEWCVKIHGSRPDLVMLDPFMGIGSSALAAQTCGIGKFIGFEIDPEYVKEAESRLSQTKEERP